MSTPTSDTHWPTALDELVAIGRSPLGPPVQLTLPSTDGPFGELIDLLGHVNGFTVFNAGIQLFHAGPGLGPELAQWNRPDLWKDTYCGHADGLLCFGQDLLGVQFAIDRQDRVVAFDPETADITEIGDSIEAWAQWLLDDPTVRGALPLATLWQDTYGPLEHHERLLPRQFFVLGGSFDLDNLMVKDSAEAMRIRGPIAAKLHGVPEGSTILFPRRRPE